MNIYIACHCKIRANEIAAQLRQNGHAIISTWHDGDFLPTDKYNDADKTRIAMQDFSEIDGADAVLLIAGESKYSGGKFVEAGFAIGRGITTYLLGRRENMMMWHCAVRSIESIEEICS